MDDYRQGLLGAGFAEVDVVDTGADLNAYAQVDNASGCCASPALVTIQGTASTCGCCDPGTVAAHARDLHGELRELLSRYNVNEYAVSARIFAVKPH